MTRKTLRKCSVWAAVLLILYLITVYVGGFYIRFDWLYELLDLPRRTVLLNSYIPMYPLLCLVLAIPTLMLLSAGKGEQGTKDRRVTVTTLVMAIIGLAFSFVQWGYEIFYSVYSDCIAQQYEIHMFSSTESMADYAKRYELYLIKTRPFEQMSTVLYWTMFAVMVVMAIFLIVSYFVCMVRNRNDRIQSRVTLIRPAVAALSLEYLAFGLINTFLMTLYINGVLNITDEQYLHWMYDLSLLLKDWIHVLIAVFFIVLLFLLGLRAKKERVPLPGGYEEMDSVVDVTYDDMDDKEETE